MLEQGVESASERSTAAYREEPAEGSATRTPGERLEAGLSADRVWRKERKETLLRGLRRGYRLSRAGIGFCVTAGLVELLTWGLNLVFGPTVEGVAEWRWWLSVIVRFGYLGLIGCGLVAITAGAFLRRRLLKQAARAGIEVIPAVRNSLPASLLPRSWRKSPKSRTVEVQEQIDHNDTHARLAEQACVGSAWAFCIAALLFVVLYAGPELPGLVRDVLEMVKSLAAVGMMLLPLAAVVGASAWLRRRELLQVAEREGLEVQDPAACPWE